MITVDRRTVMQVLGSLMTKPELLSEVDKYVIDPQDFPQQLDKYIYSAIYNLYAGGAEVIHTVDIDNYLQTNDIARTLLEKENGINFLQDCESYSEIGNFSYYYNRLKKFALLRDLQKNGQDISKIYSENDFDTDHAKINEKFETLTPTDIVNFLKGEVAILESKYSVNQLVEESLAFDGIRDLVQDLKVKPEIGLKLQGDAFNTICRGARLGKLYLRSAGSGVGKTRSMVGDACNIAYPIRYEPRYQKWVATGASEPVLYVMTEQDPAEIQTMILAYLTGYNEDMFTYGTFGEEHMDRIMTAIDIMERYKYNMRFARIPDPCASIVKMLFRKHSLQNNISHFFYDYIFSSPNMLDEYRDLSLREEVCLRLFTTSLKNLAIELNAFVMTSTQISNDDDKRGGFKDFRNIQGAKAIANLVDLGCMMSRPSPEELQAVEGFQSMYGFTPNCVTDVYKNRRGRWTMVRIWSRVDLGTCKRYDLFVTTAQNSPIEDFQVIDFNMEKTDEMNELEELYNYGIITEERAEELLQNLNGMLNTPQNPNLSNQITEAFGNAQERRRQVHESSFSDYL